MSGCETWPNLIRSVESVDDNDHGNGSGEPLTVIRASREQPSANQGSLLIDASCVPAYIRYPTDLSLLNKACEVTEKLIDRMHPQIRKVFGPMPRTVIKTSKSFLQMPRRSAHATTKLAKRLSKQLSHLKWNLASIDGLTRLRSKPPVCWKALLHNAVGS